MLFLQLLCGLGQVASPLCFPWRCCSDCLPPASVPSPLWIRCYGVRSRLALPPPAREGGTVAVSLSSSFHFKFSDPSFSLTGPPQCGPVPGAPGGAGRKLALPRPLMGYLDRGRLSRWVSLAAAVTLPVKPCKACQAEVWEQQPLLAVRLSVLHGTQCLSAVLLNTPENAVTSAGTPEHLSCVVTNKTQASGCNRETLCGRFSVYRFSLF